MQENSEQLHLLKGKDGGGCLGEKCSSTGAVALESLTDSGGLREIHSTYPTDESLFAIN